MTANEHPITILLADDDPDDRDMMRKALGKNQLVHEFFAVSNGEELMDFLHHRGPFGPPARSPVPDLILLDLNMPKMDGREVLVKIKGDPLLRRIPVVVMTTSKDEEDIAGSYDLGSNSFISKPVTLPALMDIMGVLSRYWFQTVELPQGAAGT
jgi:CheY-like chemotaxis protein